jgi:galactose mutarotase-like enzyme
MEYQISSGKSTAKITTKGGELVSFLNNGTEYVWVGNPEYWSGQAPVLFPTVGTLKNRETEIGGKVYKMRKHGFARKSEFELKSQTADSICLSLKSSDETKKSYPYDFELQITHSITDSGFKTEYRVINTDKTDIIFGIGGHAGFNCPIFKDTTFNDYSVVFEKAEDGPIYYTRLEDCDGVIHREDRITHLEGMKELKLDYFLFDRDVIVIDKLKSKSLKLIQRASGKGFEFILDGFKSIGLWTPPLKKAPFLCLEPWTVTPDFSDNSGKFEEKPDITTLAPGKDFKVSYEMNLI